MQEMVAVILAAGKGTRMKSSLPKVLHVVGGKPMLQHVMDAAREAGAARRIVVVGFGGEQVASSMGAGADYVTQKEQLGTGHALLQTKESLRGFSGTILLLCGDTPLLTVSTLKALCEAHRSSAAAATVLTAVPADPSGYGRILRDAVGGVLGIVEQKDATPEQVKIGEINTGIYCFEAGPLFTALDGLTCNNAQKEYYLTDVLAILAQTHQKVGAVQVQDFQETLGINSRVQLAEAETILRRRKLVELMESGVTIMDPASTFIDAGVSIGQDTIIYPFTWIEGATTIGRNCRIGPNTRISDSTFGCDVTLHFSYAHECKIGDGVTVGPYAHLRPDTELLSGVKVGNFVEIKNSQVGHGSKVPHLSYIGDTDMGSGVNIGCGSITVNYDGKKKHRTSIGDNAFIGCNSNMVAPVSVGNGAYVAAGSTITKDVPPRALGVGRARQLNIAGWVDNKK
ncbi:MAG TPA: bifunctional UDP-N-acetylglucosamine diphosphorylase/glucosamine-1-phosphate N-acetyltransferase GlmU [Negativicutes bacterium]|nr:bifunctional UDP-N-acetylglucosamine diphosphorylase/glucosamine-1-phosphate N-acetyltransferase GlmU [Negativicutes bacterium]